jgi:hypothetical protein
MNIRHSQWLSAALLLIPLTPAPAAPRPTVVELYTSEGCSSCPPAEAYLGELSRRADVLALSFHVDYWDDLGWRDPFSLAASTVRQSAYAARLSLRSIFTPQVIVDGRESFVGSDRGQIGKWLTPARAAGLPIGLEHGNRELIVSVGPQSIADEAEIFLIPFRRRAVSSIGRGENQGRTIEEFNVVRGVRLIGRSRPQESQLRVPMDSLPKDATDVAVLAQRPHHGEIVGSARLDLASSAGSPLN